MFDKLLQSLPEPLRKIMGVEETQEEEASEHSEEESEESHDSEANEAAPEDKKKKQISTLIRVIAVVALGYMALTEFVFKPEPENVAPVVNAKPRRVRKKPAIENKSEDAKVGSATKSAQDASAVNKTTESHSTATAQVQEQQPPQEPQKPEVSPEVTKNAEGLAPAENINIAEKPAETPQEVTPPPPPVEPAPQVGEVAPKENTVEKSLDTLIDNMDNAEGKAADVKKKTKLEEKIVTEEAYTPPPAYDQVGRGLVYNCKDKYWACLDKTAYVTCNKNMKWNKEHGKPSECVVQSVYTSDEDCSTVQKYNVSMSVSTAFCQ